MLKLDPSGTVLLVLGRINTGAEADWLLNKPADVAFAKNGDIYVAGVLNWRFQVFARTAPTGNMTKYIPSVRKFWGAVPSVGWSSKQTDIPLK